MSVAPALDERQFDAIMNFESTGSNEHLTDGLM